MRLYKGEWDFFEVVRLGILVKALGWGLGTMIWSDAIDVFGLGGGGGDGGLFWEVWVEGCVTLLKVGLGRGLRGWCWVGTVVHW